MCVAPTSWHRGVCLCRGWRYCSNLTDPEAVRVLLQAVLTAASTIHFARTQVNPRTSPLCPIG